MNGATSMLCIEQFAGAMTPVLYSLGGCTHSLTLFLRHHNLVYLWSVFSMRLAVSFRRAQEQDSCLQCSVGSQLQTRGRALAVIVSIASRVGRTYWLSSTVSINCTCVRLVLQIKEPEYPVLSTKGLNKFEYVLICCSPSLISSSGRPCLFCARRRNIYFYF